VASWNRIPPGGPAPGHGPGCIPVLAEIVYENDASSRMLDLADVLKNGAAVKTCT
jgi:hypothetical protein